MSIPKISQRSATFILVSALFGLGCIDDGRPIDKIEEPSSDAGPPEECPDVACDRMCTEGPPPARCAVPNCLCEDNNPCPEISCDAVCAGEDAVADIPLGCPIPGCACDGEVRLPPPSNWTPIDSDCHFGFIAPSDIEEQPAEGTDSCVAQYTAGGCTYTADVGWYSPPLDTYAGMPQYDEVYDRIDGRRARVVTFQPGEGSQEFFAGVHFSSIDDDDEMKMTFSAWCDSLGSQQTARRVFGTITFDD